MEETTSIPPQSSDLSTAECVARLEKQVIADMDVLVNQLQSSQQAGKLDPFTFKSGVQQISGLVQASLLIHTLPSLLVAPPIDGSLQTADLYKKIKQVADTVQELCRDQMRQAIADKATKILDQIHAKEQKITKKQQEIVQSITSKMTVH